MFVDDTTVAPAMTLPMNPGFIGEPKNTRELDDKTQSRGLLDDTSGEARRRDIVNDYIAQVMKSRGVDPERTLKARFHWKWYDDLAAAAAAIILRRDVNPEKLARRNALDDYINKGIKSRDVDPEQTLQARMHWKWYDDLAAAAAAIILRRDVNPEKLARRNALDDYINKGIKSRDVNPVHTIQARMKWYEDLIAAVAAKDALAILRRDVNPEILARRDALTP